MSDTVQRRHKAATQINQLISIHKLTDADFAALATLFTTLAGLGASGPTRAHTITAAVEDWIASQ